MGGGDDRTIVAIDVRPKPIVVRKPAWLSSTRIQGRRWDHAGYLWPRRVVIGSEFAR